MVHEVPENKTHINTSLEMFHEVCKQMNLH